MSGSADPGSLRAAQQQLIEALPTPLQRLAISSQSPSPAAVSASSSQVYRDNLRTVKLPKFDGSGKQDKVNEFINIFTVLKSLNGLIDKDLVRLAVQHLRGPALLWWVEAADSGRSEFEFFPFQTAFFSILFTAMLSLLSSSTYAT